MSSEEILQRCLADVAAGRRTPAECAAQYPEVPGLLGELLAAQALMAWTPPVMAAATARRHEAQLRAALAGARQMRRATLRPSFLWVGLAILVVGLTLGSAATASASAGSLPGQALYPVKRAIEAAATSLTPSSQQAAWHAALATRRTGELIALAGQPSADADQMARLATEGAAETGIALDNVATAPTEQQAAVLASILTEIQRHEAVLLALQAALPDQAQAGLEQAEAASQSNHAEALRQLNTINNRPDDLPAGPPATHTPRPEDTHVPPGQAKKTATPTPKDTKVVPGQAKKTATATAAAPEPTKLHGSPTDKPGESPGHASQTAAAATQAGAGAEATPCPLNGAGKPVCGNRP